jgi:YggT family protein
MTGVVSFVDIILSALRPLVFLVTLAAAVLACASWAVQTGRLNAFSTVARALRRPQQRLFQPMERRLLRAGGLPSHAPWWTVVLVGVGGLVAISLIAFVRDQLAMLGMATAAGRGALLVVAIRWTFAFLNGAIFARVIASWVGGSPFSKWWRWAFKVTEPLLGPLRSVLPTLGPIDISPIVLYFGLSVFERLLLGAIG